VSRVAQPAAPAWSQRPPLDLPAAAHKPVRVVLQELGSTRTGLTSGQAASRLGTVGRNVLASHRVTALGVLGRQLRNPLLVLLLAAAGVSAATGDPTDGAIIAAIVALSVGLGFLSEYRSELAVAALHASIRHQALVWRDGSQQRLDVGDLVPGDVVALAVGDVVPADLRLVEADQLECDEAVLTGEPVPAVKTTDPVPAGDATLELPSDPQERAVWRAAAAELDGHRRAYGLHHERPAKHAGARVVRDGGAAPPATAPTGGPADGQRGSTERRRSDLEGARRGPTDRQPPAPQRARAAAHRVGPSRLLGAEPRRDHPGRRRDWEAAWTALERLADHHRRGREDRYRAHERADRAHGRDLGRQERDGR
jgi:hypothetical protein